MKKSFIIYTLFLSTSFFISYSSPAQQQQQKPSERSFKAEIEKVKQIQATRNIKISQLPQPAANTTVASDNNKQATVIEQNQTANTSTSTQKIQPIPATKPSGGSMKLPKKPVSKG
jgi:hypothetical protein